MDCWLCLVAATGDEERLVIVSYLMGAIVVSRFLLALWSERHIVRLNVHVCPSASLYSVSFARTHAYIYTYMLTHSLCLTVRAYMYECTCLSVCVCVSIVHTGQLVLSCAYTRVCTFYEIVCWCSVFFFLLSCFDVSHRAERRIERQNRVREEAQAVTESLMR